MYNKVTEMNPKKQVSNKTRKRIKSLAILLIIAQVLTSLAISSQGINAQTTTIFEDDYESGNLSKWDEIVSSSGESVSTHTYAPYQGRVHGRYASDGSGSSDNAYTSVDVNEGEILVSGYFYPIQGLPLSDNDDRFYLIRLQANGQSVAAAGVRRRNGVDNWIIFARDGSGWVGPIYSSTPSINAKWYKVDLHWVKSSSKGLVELFIDGKKILEINNLDTDNYGNVDTVNLGFVGASGIQQNMIVYSDLVKISGTQPQEPIETPPPQSSGNPYGVTYMSADWKYRESDYYYRRDFQLFKEQGITLITLLTHWQDFEPYRGYFDTNLFKRMNHVAELANEYGIKVIYNVHTTYSGYDVPRYVGNFKYLFTSQSLYNAHLNALQEFVKRLDGPNVFGFQIHNEPVNADWGINVGVNAWTKLFVDSVAACKQVTNKPISVRIAAGSFSAFDDRVFDIFDFISINYYSEWHSESSLRSAIQKAHQKGKLVVISEYGASTSNDLSQASSIKNYISLFEDLDVDYSTAWWYCPLAGPSSYDYNLFDDRLGKPRLAFYEFGKANN